MLKDFTKEEIQKIADESNSWQEILDKLGYKSRGSLITIKNYFIKNNIQYNVSNIVTKICPICGEEFSYENKGLRKFCFNCSPSTNNSTFKFMAFKKNWIKSHGGGCCRCGYNKCIDALDFHHINPEEKEFSISNKGNKSIEDLMKEAEKCIILCSNCHREEHANEDRFDWM